MQYFLEFQRAQFMYPTFKLNKTFFFKRNCTTCSICFASELSSTSIRNIFHVWCFRKERWNSSYTKVEIFRSAFYSRSTIRHVYLLGGLMSIRQLNVRCLTVGSSLGHRRDPPERGGHAVRSLQLYTKYIHR